MSDIVAFRTGRWKLDWFLTMIRAAVEWAIEPRATFDFLATPHAYRRVDPEFKTVDLILDLVKRSDGKPRIVGLDALAARAAK